MLTNLKDCFQENFETWLLRSNFQFPDGETIFSPIWEKIQTETLKKILDILIKQNDADYFWFTYPEHGCELSYSLPHHDVVPSDSLRVDKEKIKAFLREWKISCILGE